MKRVVLILLSTAGCEKNQTFGDVWSREGKVYTERAYVYGWVSNARTGDFVDPGEVDVGDMPATTRWGFYIVRDVPPGRRVVHGSSPGFAPGTKVVDVPQNGGVLVDFSLLPYDATATFAPSEGGTVSTDDGTSVTFSPCDMGGASTVTASLAAIDVPPGFGVAPEDSCGDGQCWSDVGESACTCPLDCGELCNNGCCGVDWCAMKTMPGNLSTDQGDMLQTYGAVSVELRDQDGNAVDATACPAAEVRIAPGAGTPETVDQWKFDPDDGTWTSAGDGFDCSQATGEDTCRGTLPSLGWWNCDQPLETTCLRACVVDQEGAAAPGVEVVAHGFNYSGWASAFTGDDGCTCLAIRRGGIVDVNAIGSAGIAESGSGFTAGDTVSSCSSGDCEELAEPLRLARPLFQAFLFDGGIEKDPAGIWRSGGGGHLVGPCADGSAAKSAWHRLTSWLLRDARAQEGGSYYCTDGRFHVCYGSERDGVLFDVPHAYVRPTSSCGREPMELTVITRFQTGTYRYSVAPRALSGDQKQSSLVGSKVLILLPTGVVREFSSPADIAEGQVWIVGDIECDAATCAWRSVNRIVPASDPAAIHPDGVAPHCGDLPITAP